MGDVRRLLLPVVALVALAAVVLPPAGAGAVPVVRATVIGDSAATGMLWNPKAMKILSRGTDLDMQVAVCRRLTGESCPFEGDRPSTLVQLVRERGERLGPTVVIVVGYNDFEQTFAASVEESVDEARAAGVKRILWATLRAIRRPYLPMNAELWAAAARYPEMTVIDWNRYSRSHEDWFQNDGLHLTRDGGVAMATLLHESIMRRGPEPRIVLPRAGLEPAVAGRLYSARLVARRGAAPYAWAVVWGSPPAGLRFTATGRLYGRPREVGRFALVLRAEDKDGAVGLRRVALVVRSADRD